MTATTIKLLKQLIDAERQYWLDVANSIHNGNADSDGITGNINWRSRGIEVGVDLTKSKKHSWLKAASDLVDIGLAEWCEGHREFNYLRLACDKLNNLETLKFKKKNYETH